MAIQLTETSTTERFELVVRNRHVGLAVGAGVFAVLTWVTLIRAWGGPWDALSIGLNGVTAILFTYFALFFSVLRTRIVIDDAQILIHHAGMVLDVGIVRIARSKLVSSAFSPVDHPLTGNKLVAWTLVDKDAGKKVVRLSLPRLKAGQVIEHLKSRLAN